ncbi:Nif3-like dinuclear metal center hexameric protein [Chryseolinea sp. H1M3-3]|uniref:Nif3-like dinuclear metal center hexameric protein n=1 Tax=Chryseolinea sp. H1M3-3 TaxID=3034144 RepID=UPI0023EB459C|nr:Nif3-like dinuclear metal center hexameric protein [Chryseolinea sp. H1M3-3]
MKKSRREFLSKLGFALGASSALPHFSAAQPSVVSPLHAKMSIQQVIDLILTTIPGAPFKETVDTIKSGDGQQEVRGIITTMFATIDVVKQAVVQNVNFIIAHEPTFYNHRDDTSWLETDRVFQYKNDLLKKHNIVVWRFHDYWHTHKPDGVQMGVLTKLGWQKYFNVDNPRLVVIPPISLAELITHSKKSLGIRQVRFIGDLNQVCKRIALSPGAAGGRSQIQLLQREKPDVLIVGEISEWETAEYIRDAQSMQLPMSLIVLGHAESEEPGMEWLVSWLQPKIPDVKVTHVPSNYPFKEA